MITRRLSEALIRAAARRWPERLRAGVRREWTAELAVLAEEHHRWRMLRYAVSLATHPAPRPTTTSTPVLVRAWHAIRLLVVGPLLCGVLLAVNGMIILMVLFGPLINQLSRWLPYWLLDWTMKAQLPLLSLLCLGSAYLLAELGHRWAPAGLSIAPLLLTATVPGFLLFSTVLSLDGPSTSQWRPVSVGAVFFLGLIVLLYFVARRARTGRRRSAWWLGALGAFGIADIAVMPAVLSIQMDPQEGAIAIAYAPMWLPALLTDWGFGLPHPSAAEVFVITDVLVGVPQMVMIVTGWALGLVLGTTQSEPVAAAAVV